MENKLIKLDTPELQGIEKSKAEQIRKIFLPMAEMLSGFEEAYNNLVSDASEEITQDITYRAKRLRLDIGKIRIETGKLKDKQKEYIKLEDRAIMGVHNILVWAVKEKEDKLQEIERYYETQEKLRLERLQSERMEMIQPYVAEDFERDLSGMDQDVWNAYFSTKKNEYEERIAAEKKAEAERIAKEKAEAEERKRIASENEKLKKEAEAREKAEQERKVREEAERKAREEKERKERAEYEAKLKAEREAREKVEREERAKREKLEAELKAKEEAERKAREAEEARLQAELKKGDEAKIQDLISDLQTLKTKYSFQAEKNKAIYAGVSQLIDKIVNYISQS